MESITDLRDMDTHLLLSYSVSQSSTYVPPSKANFILIAQIPTTLSFGSPVFKAEIQIHS